LAIENEGSFGSSVLGVIEGAGPFQRREPGFGIEGEMHIATSR
jgi:hypothetical protein